MGKNKHVNKDKLNLKESGKESTKKEKTKDGKNLGTFVFNIRRD